MILEKRHAYDEHKQKGCLGMTRKLSDGANRSVNTRVCLRARTCAGAAPYGQQWSGFQNLYLSLSPSLVLGVIRYIIDRYGTVS